MLVDMSIDYGLNGFKMFCFYQESYVWKMYQERCWEFFPVGDCFRKQYEDQLG
jgi:hypothetical protein